MEPERESKRTVGKQNNSDMCIVCGKVNPLSLRADFYILEDEILLCVTRGRDEHQSYPDRMHGGMISAILDETIGRAVQIAHPEVWGVTGKLEVTFRKPVRLNAVIRCYAKIVKFGSLAFVGKGYIEDEAGTLLATGEATYVRTPIEKMTDESFVWAQFPDSLPRPDESLIRHPELLK